MKTKCATLLSAFVLCFGSPLAWADPPSQFRQNATFTTLILTTRPIEGLTGDGGHNLYTGGSGSTPCPIWRINLHKPSLEVIGNVQEAVTPPLPDPTHGTCTFAGITFDAVGNLYQSDLAAGIIYMVTGPNTKNPPDAIVFAEGVPGTNGLAFDRDGNLWTGDGTTGQGRVWKITGPGANCTAATDKPVKYCEEVFRIPPVRNGTALGGKVSAQTEITAQGVGRQNRDFPPGTLTITVPASTSDTIVTPAGGQDLVANGIAFDRQGDMFVIDTARGALWKVEFDRRGNLKSPTGCDSTFKGNTLCLSNIFVSHPILEGGDGIALDVAGNIWVAANERNAVAVVTKDGRVTEIFRNPVNANTLLRNEATDPVDNNHILEFPTSPFLSGDVFCTAQSDLDRRDNSPRSAGQINGLGKISCMDQPLIVKGLPLPIR